jgi:hypothetical protein
VLAEIVEHRQGSGVEGVRSECRRGQFTELDALHSQGDANVVEDPVIVRPGQVHGRDVVEEGVQARISLCGAERCGKAGEPIGPQTRQARPDHP